jgi:hypothetical protein
VADADRVVGAVEARRDQQALAQPAEVDAHVRMLQRLQGARDRHQQHVLRRRHADRQRDHGQVDVAQQIVQQVVPVVAPQIHVLLAVVQAVQGPPPAELVLAAVEPVIEEVQHHQVDQEAGQRAHAGHQRLQVKRVHALHAQRAGHAVHDRVEGEEYRHREEAQAVDQGVDEVVPARGAVAHLLRRDQGFQRAQDQEQGRHLAGPGQEPFDALEGVLGVLAHAGIEQEGLDHGLEQPALEECEPIDEVLNHFLN